MTQPLEIRKSIKSLIVKVFGILFNMLITLLIARIISVETLGNYGFVNRILGVLIVFTQFGLPIIILKKTAIYKDKNPERINILLRSSQSMTLLISIAVIVITIAISHLPLINHYLDDEMFLPLVIFLISLIPQTFSRIYSGVLFGIGSLWQGLFFENVLSMLISVSILLLSIYLVENLDFLLLAFIFLGSRLCSYLCVKVYFARFTNFRLSRGIVDEDLFSSSAEIALSNLGSAVVGSCDVILLGFFAGSREVAFYTVAISLSLISTILLTVINSQVSPRIAKLFNEGQYTILEGELNKVNKFLFMFGVFQLLTVFIFGNKILLLWGSDFVEAYPILMILSMGQFFNVITGSVGALLTMSGEQKIYRKITSIVAIFNVILLTLIVPRSGSIGAALVTSLSVFAMNLSRLIFIVKKLKINPYKFIIDERLIKVFR